MSAYGRYISKFLASFLATLLALLLLNLAAFFGTFQRAVREDYGDTAPRAMLERAAGSASAQGLAPQMEQELRRCGIWAMLLAPDGVCLWQMDTPPELPAAYTVQDVAQFTRGYLCDYPVFVHSGPEGLLVLGYPKGSYAKLTGNYYSVGMLKTIPVFLAGVGACDVAVLCALYVLSRRRLLKGTEPIISSVEALAEGRPVDVKAEGELADVAKSVNRASQVLSRQNEARANWIHGVSHDIRTPLSMVMGYAERIARNEAAGPAIREQAKIIERQSVQIKELVQDLNLVSQLEYEMQPLHKEPVRLARLVRACAAELLNGGLPDAYTVEVAVGPGAEAAALEGDARLLARALTNLAQNSIRHNPQGCGIRLCATDEGDTLCLAVEDDGCGLLAEQQVSAPQPAGELDLRHGLGLLLVRRIAQAHGGVLELESAPQQGCKARLRFPKQA